MIGFDTLEVMESFEVPEELERTNVSAELHLQCRVYDDGSRSRPFVKIRLAVGSRALFCDVLQANLIGSAIEELVPKAEAKIQQLTEEKRANWEAKRFERQQQDRAKRKRRIQRPNTAEDK